MNYQIIQIGHPTLRNKARTLSKEEILSDNIRTLVDSMIAVMRDAPGVGLAAPQINVGLQIIVVEDRPEYTENTPKEMLEARERKPFPLHVLINPRIVEKKADEVEFFEGCLSVEGFVSVVPRKLEILVEALNEKAEPVRINARGWYARILQHEIDHLQGILCTDRMKVATLTTIENYKEYWLDKPVSETT